MITSPFWLWLAAGLSFTIVLLHIFGGGRQAVPPLLSSALSDGAKYINYYCWHLVTIVLIGMTLAFAIAAMAPEAWELAVAATLLSIVFTLWSVIMIMWKKLKWFVFPQWLLFLVLAAIGIVGVI